jgi:hypothetical protein
MFIRNSKFKGLVILIVSFLFLTILFSVNVKAQSGFVAGCMPPQGVPVACPTDFIPNLDCQLERIVNPGTDCCPNMCPGGDLDTDQPDELQKLNVFGTTLLIGPESVPLLINLALSAFLGIVSLYALIRGIYLGAIKRPQTIDDKEIGDISKEIKNLLIGFIIAWSFIFITQIVVQFLGLGSLQDLTLIGTNDGLVITVE